MATARHLWTTTTLAQGLKIEEEEATAFVEKNAAALTAFFSAEGPQKIFILQAVDGSTPPKPTGLTLWDEKSDVRRGKLCYFLKNTKDDAAVDTSKAVDNTVVFGEIKGDALQALVAMFSGVFQPLLKNCPNPFGKANKSQEDEFKQDMDKFVKDLRDAVKHLSSGVELRMPDKAYDPDTILAKGQSNRDGDMISHFEDLLSEWCNTIEECLAFTGDSGDEGLMSELDFWRQKMQRLTSITEHFRTKECKMVIGYLSALTKDSAEQKRESAFKVMMRWKQIDINLTEAANEAKNNVKYLFTLERFVEPLYNGTPTTIIETLPAMMNSIKMIHTVARYYNTTERMTNLLMKITHQMIENCKNCILAGCSSPAELWKQDPEQLVRNLEVCLKLNEAYQEQYRLTKEKLAATPKGRQFDFPENNIFGKFNHFCRRVIKLIDLFSTIHQFSAFSKNYVEGMDNCIEMFEKITSMFERKHKNDLLQYDQDQFDRDLIEFNVKISDLEGVVQQFIDESFTNTKSIENSLLLLQRFRTVLQRESLKKDLDSKLNVIFHNYAAELQDVLRLYEKQKTKPPIPRNLPPVAGNIMWSRHLLQRIMEPMKIFEANQNVLASTDAKEIIKVYNNVARMLVQFEYLWYQNWIKSIDNVKASLQATLVVRHPDDGKLYVNLDRQIMQLIREAKCLERMEIDIPSEARIVLLQEATFKAHFNDLSHALAEYDNVLASVVPVTANLLRPQFNDMEFRLRPGMTTLSWTSMNLGAYKSSVFTGLHKLEALVVNIGDIIENRVETNLKIVSKAMLVSLPGNTSFTLEEFVQVQRDTIETQGSMLEGKNVEVENAVDDLIKLVKNYPMSFSSDPSFTKEERTKLKKHYSNFLYQAFLHCIKSSLSTIKKRVAKRLGFSFINIDKPLFEVDVQLAIPNVKLSPSLDDIQSAVNEAAKSVLSSARTLWDWDQQHLGAEDRVNLYGHVTKDLQIVRVCLLLTGSVQGTRNRVQEFLSQFSSYNWMWEHSKAEDYAAFMETEPSDAQHELKLLSYVGIVNDVGSIPREHNVGALSLNTTHLTEQLLFEGNEWLLMFAKKMRERANKQMDEIFEYIRVAGGKAAIEVIDLSTLAKCMTTLKAVRDRETEILLSIDPILHVYELLEIYMTEEFIPKAQMDQKSVLRTSWKKLIHACELKTQLLSGQQGIYKKELIRDVTNFVDNVAAFRDDFIANGPMVQGIKPMEAVDRLTRFKEELAIRMRKEALYQMGEDLFAMPTTEYPELSITEKDLKLQNTLFGLYLDVVRTMEEWETIEWTEVQQNVETMTSTIDAFALRCKKMPVRLRDYEAYAELKKLIEDFQTILPLLTELSKDSIMPRHWDEVKEITHSDFDVESSDFTLKTLVDAKVVDYAEFIEEITEGADKQLKIEEGIAEIVKHWEDQRFDFMEWKGRGIQVLKGVVPIVEDLEECEMNLQTMLTMRHVTPFREETQDKLQELSETSETLERWIKVQMLWCSLESVFTGGDIAKQMPVEAKKFQKIDKDYSKLMAQAFTTELVIECCLNELLRSSLPIMFAELEKCQKSLEGYLEQKRNKFPRFYFVSNPSLLLILSQGSDPVSMNSHYEKVFDSIFQVVHDKKDKTIITTILSGGGKDDESVPFSQPVKAVGNIEDWLLALWAAHQVALKDINRNCAVDIQPCQTDVKALRFFVDNYVAQMALLGIQLLWTTVVQTSLDSMKIKKSAMRDQAKNMADVLVELSGWCLQDLGSKKNRMKIECLVTIHLHQKDVSAELNTLHKQKQLTDANDFQWLMQARFAWTNEHGCETAGDGAQVITVTDVDFNYQFEYLGCKERLVVTPLTDRCYISLAQALGMYFGGAPAGPAGTGKTETTKDMGRALGVWVVVTNCTDQQSYLDCAKIFKGLCQGGLWGCFDEFNRIQLPVLSVVAQYVLSILNAKKAAVEYFQFPGDPTDILILPVCGFFITMNPGYAGRQELPENLKALFRGVVMMVPDFQIIMKVKLCSVGYSEYEYLSKKFFVLYNTNKEQLSNQRHYDWGLRNILSVLRTAGATKRANLEASESTLLYQTLRDMNLSKLVSQDVPLFLSLLSDLFPSVAFPPTGEHPEEEAAMAEEMDKCNLTHHPAWCLKCVQLFETQLVRHGIMLVGPTCGGKSKVFHVLAVCLTKTLKIPHKQTRMNPKAIRAPEMYGEVDPMSGEWTTGCFAAIWAKCNTRSNKFISWIVMDGPVDAIWIEDLNTVLDDNRILTLANGDRIPMTDNTKIMFEVETLMNASPATVSRAGIVYVSDTDLDWAPVMESWIRTRKAEHQPLYTALVLKYLGVCTATNPGHMLDYCVRNLNTVFSTCRVAYALSLTSLLDALTVGPMSCESVLGAAGDGAADALEKLFLYSMAWSVGALLENEDRAKFDEYLRHLDETSMPELTDHANIYEYFVDLQTFQWTLWRPPAWQYPDGAKLDFSNLLVPTMDSTRSLFLVDFLQRNKKGVLMCGGPGTAKSSCAYMFLNSLDVHSMLSKVINFSSATTPFMFQNTVESQLDKRGGKNFGPANGKKMTMFLDDISMPLVNDWGDQPTLEAVRIVVEQGYFTFLDKDKRGDFKCCEDLQWLGAMIHPGGGRNDIPNRLKSKFFIFNLVLPSITSINDIYGQMLAGRFTKKEFDAPAMECVSHLTKITIQLWNKMKQKMLPTPAKFHYVFNMRDLSRVFQGVLLTPKGTYQTGGGQMATDGVASHLIDKKVWKLEEKMTGAGALLAVWKHECERVFCDKLTTDEDKGWYMKYVETLVDEFYEEDLHDQCREGVFMVSCLREDIYDDDGVFQEFAPKVYELGGDLNAIRDRVSHFMSRHNEEFPQKKQELVLFNDALKHLLRISRLVEMPRGSALLVGVGGSGKQSLTKLAGYISNAFCFQITLSKTYNTNSLMEDLQTLYKSAGHQRKPTVFLFTESEIKDEIFLELINSVLMTGEVAGLFAKDEIMAICADLRTAFLKERPGQEESTINMRQFFIDSVRDNLHLVLCMSPLNPKFPERARMFPGLIAGPTIDWFLPWPEEALVAVSFGLISSYPVKSTPEVKTALMEHMGSVHAITTAICDDYKLSMRRNVYQTPKSYLSFIEAYKKMYKQKLDELEDKESRVNLGLDKLIGGAKDVEAMKIVLADEQVKLEVATEETNKMLASLEISSAEAKKEEQSVMVIAANCNADATRIAGEKTACMSDLAKAQPFVDEAETAIDSIKPAHIGEIKKLPKPADIIKLVFDGVLLLFKGGLNPVAMETLVVAKQEVGFIATSYVPHAQGVMGDTNFLKNVQEFGKVGKDQINEETIELLCPYMELENFNPQVAKNASAAAEGLCTWVRAMKFYHEASKIVKPKLEALAVAEGQLDAANKALKGAQARLDACKATLDELQRVFEAQMLEKKRIEDGALALQRKMAQASELIGGLSGERIRWTEDSNNFASVKERLVGDCAISCAFVSYCGPFNQDYRHFLVVDKYYADCKKRGVPATEDLDVASFLVDQGTVGDWAMQSLPGDKLSIQNGILVTRSSRYPLLIDPQAQAITWLKSREAERLPHFGVTSLNHPKLKDQLEYAMAEGKTLLVTGVEQEIDPMLDPVLEKQILVKGRSKTINVGDKNMDYSDDFLLYFVTRLPNPHFSPELQAKSTVIDFTVTQQGLEEQLLGKVISVEQHALEEQLNQVLQDANSNTKALLKLDSDLLNRLTSNTGNLLEDDELIGVLANTKAKAGEVTEKLKAAEETKININEKREQFRPVACRGAVLYFAIVEMSLVNCMYQVSLEQFTGLFKRGMAESEKASLASKRVANIIEVMTYVTYRYINRGLYEADKLLFTLLVTAKILVTAKQLSGSDVALFLRAGAALDINTVKKKPFKWLSNEAWLNVIQLSKSNKFFANLPNELTGNEGMWQRWFNDNEPEQIQIPDYEARLLENEEVGPFYKLLLLRSMRTDRTNLACKQFVSHTKEMGPTYVSPVTDTIESIYAESVNKVPIIFLLSPGADPTDSLETLARKNKLPLPAAVSLGQGQEPVAMKAMNAAAVAGTWVLLQNCELGLPLMEQMEEYLTKLESDQQFRLFLSCLPHKDFPLGLLQMATKVTNEPPAGLQAGLLKSYTVMVDQDRLERIESPMWRQLVFAICFLHSVVQERRKFGPLGWCIPYEYNNGDLTACILFLEKHLYAGAISWVTLQYMIAEAQYGGRITDNTDRRMFSNYANTWVDVVCLEPDYTYNPAIPIAKFPKDFVYTIPNLDTIEQYRAYCSSMPEVDSPEVFGLHPNADLTYRVKSANHLLAQMSESQPKGGGGGGGQSPSAVVYDKAAELAGRMPEYYKEDDYKFKINKLGGLSVPLNIFLFQEIQRLQNVLNKVGTMLKSIQLAINGEVVMTAELQDAITFMFEAKPPKTWVYTVSGDEFSWILPTLGLWWTSFLERDDQDRTWMEHGRPKSYWLTGFFNPCGLLTAMKQEVTRKHKGEAWALDDVIYHTEATQMMGFDHVRSPPTEGVYLHGLFLDGGAYDKNAQHMCEQEPKKLFVPLPVLLVGANIATAQVKVVKDLYGPQGPYVAPVYKYPARTDRFYVFQVNIRCTPEKHPIFWGLRGVCLLCNTS